MASYKEENAMIWKDHANNFSISFEDLLQSKQLVDVKLVADGYIFDAHRLVLSALSPYFRQMFTQMPANQQAYVFMKDVTKQTIEHLITFIYCGEVNVSRENVDDFLKTAEALKIKGLADGCYEQAFDLPASMSTGTTSAYNHLQYQSSQTVQIPKSINQNDAFQFQDDFKYENLDSFNGNDNSNNDHDNNYKFDNEDSVMDTSFDGQHYQRNADSGNGVDETPTIANVPEVKRAKPNRDKSEFNIIADLRQNASGGENLFHNGFKYSKYGKGVQTQNWRCSKAQSKGCRATVTTKEINGVIMMKVLHDDHFHQPDDQNEF